MDTLSQHERSDFLTLQELGQRLGLGKTVLYELANRDALPIPAVRIGRQFRFSRHAYDEFRRRQHGEPQEAIAS